MTTDKDIIAALHGMPSAADRETTAAIAETYGRPAAAREDAGQRRGDAFEATALWAAKEATATATAALAQALMRSNPDTGIYAAEADAKKIAFETYEEVAKGIPYEINRQEAVARVVTKLAEQFGRPAAKLAQPAAKRGPQKESARRAPVRVTEIARPGSVRVIK
ncbi:hypothetical protein [Arthrobacter sp. UYEF36]|uniref:hypothetical protein n=1 Tax=Arthrobacter sp. UYEF36 TaxID=1756366 RepID=UPI003394076B